MDPLVSVSWLAAHLSEQNLLVLDATLPVIGVQPRIDPRAGYTEQHIPGAVFFDIEALSDKATALPHMLATEESFGKRMSELGVGDAMTLVVYEAEGVFSAPRAWWMLRTMGARDVRILDGGLQAWKEAGYTTEAGDVTKPRVAFQARLQANAVRSFSEIQAVVSGREAGEQVLDARPAGRFTGKMPEPRAGLPSGHMPGAINVPFTELIQSGRLKSADDLHALFTSRGVDITIPITTTCGSGVTAAVLAVGLERCGVTKVKLYDGSWTEYAQHPDAVVVAE